MAVVHPLHHMRQSKTNEMGCSGSSETKSRATSGQILDTLDTFLRLDREIWREEKAAPAPSLGHYMARLEKLNTEIEAASGERSLDDPDSQGPNWTSDPSEEGIQRAIVELQINQNPKNATEHEEFIANLTRQALRQSRLSWLRVRQRDTQQEISRLGERVQHLQGLYEQLDSLFSRTESEGSALTELELQLDRVRSYRDTLYSAELSWREGARLCQAAGTLASAARHAWISLHNITNVVTRFRMATDCRNAIQEAALCIQTAQSSLPGVLFPYCTLREIAALLQVIDYIYTDLQIPERYSHALDVYNSFQKRATLLSNWIQQMMEDTIRKDVQDVDQRIVDLAARLSNERANSIRHKIGLKTSRYDNNGDLKKKLKMDFKREKFDPQHSPWLEKKTLSHPVQEDVDYSTLMWK